MKNCLVSFAFLTMFLLPIQAMANSNTIVQNNTGKSIKVAGHLIPQGGTHVSAFPATIETVDGRKITIVDTGRYCKPTDNGYKPHGWKFEVHNASYQEPRLCMPLSGGAIGCIATLVQMKDGWELIATLRVSSKCTGEWFRENEGLLITIGEIFMTVLEPELIIEDAVKLGETAAVVAARAAARALKNMSDKEIQKIIKKKMKKEAFKEAKNKAKEEGKKAVLFSGLRTSYEAAIAAHAARHAGSEYGTAVSVQLARNIHNPFFCFLGGAHWNGPWNGGHCAY